MSSRSLNNIEAKRTTWVTQEIARIFRHTVISTIIVSVSAFFLAVTFGAMVLSARPEIPLRELEAVIAVPLIILYLLARAISVVASRVQATTKEEREQLSVSAASRRIIGAIVVFAGLLFILVATVSALTYQAMGMSWATVVAFGLVKACLSLVGFVSTLMVVKSMCRPLISIVASRVAASKWPLHLRPSH